MDYENKNKDAISTIKQALRQLATNGVPVGNMIKAINDIEEKYAESEDERIRNFLIKQANSVLDSITDDDEEVPAWKSALAWLEKQGNNMGISEATKKKLEDNLNKALEKETPESWNKFLDEQGEQKPVDNGESNLLTVERAKEISPFMNSCFENEPADKIESRQEELTEFEKAVKQVMKEAIECGDTHNLKTDAAMLLRLVQKPALSEEDERIYKSILYSFANNYPLTVQQQEFVKSLKERYTWRPSYEQVSVLEFVMEDIEKDSIRYRILKSVLEELKKLREK